MIQNLFERTICDALNYQTVVTGRAMLYEVIKGNYKIQTSVEEKNWNNLIVTWYNRWPTRPYYLRSLAPSTLRGSLEMETCLISSPLNIRNNEHCALNSLFN